jgi:hypothetical protein
MDKIYDPPPKPVRAEPVRQPVAVATPLKLGRTSQPDPDLAPIERTVIQTPDTVTTARTATTAPGTPQVEKLPDVKGDSSSPPATPVRAGVAVDDSGIAPPLDYVKYFKERGYSGPLLDRNYIINSIAKTNNIPDPSKIKVGQVITINDANGTPYQYRIGKGDNLWNISRGILKGQRVGASKKISERVTIGSDGKISGGLRPDPNAPPPTPQEIEQRRIRQAYRQAYNREVGDWESQSPFSGVYRDLPVDVVQKIATGDLRDVPTNLGRTFKWLSGVDRSQWQSKAQEWLDWKQKQPNKDIDDWIDQNKNRIDVRNPADAGSDVYRTNSAPGNTSNATGINTGSTFPSDPPTAADRPGNPNITSDERLNAMRYLAGMRPDASGRTSQQQGGAPGLDTSIWSNQELQAYKPQPATAAPAAKPAEKPAARPAAAPAVPAAKPAPAAPNANNELSFGQAFTAARRAATAAGNPASGKFTWQGKDYQTNLAGEDYLKPDKLTTVPATSTNENKSYTALNKMLNEYKIFLEYGNAQDPNAQTTSQQKTSSPEEQAKVNKEKQDQRMDIATAKSVASSIKPALPPSVDPNALAGALVKIDDQNSGKPSKPLTQPEQMAMGPMNALVTKAAVTGQTATTLSSILRSVADLAKKGKA